MFGSTFLIIVCFIFLPLGFHTFFISGQDFKVFIVGCDKHHQPIYYRYRFCVWDASIGVIVRTMNFVIVLSRVFPDVTLMWVQRSNRNRQIRNLLFCSQDNEHCQNVTRSVQSQTRK